VLGVERVGIEDNFFELGGDSIRSIQIVARVKALGLQVSVQQLFRHQTIAELLAASNPTEENLELWSHTKPFELLSLADREKMPADVEDAYPLTALQSGMLYHMELTRGLTGSPDYHNVDSFYYRLPFEHAAFQQAVDYVVQRHPVLRTSFDLTSFSEPLQLVHSKAALVVQAEDIRHCLPTEQERIIKQYVERERNQYFDMSQPPLLRFHVHHRTDDSFQFTVTEFHPILDGWSIHSIFAQIFKRYLSLLKKEEVDEDKPVTISFRDFVALERKTMQSDACHRYWEGIVGDYERLALPTWSSSDASAGRPRYNKIAFPVPLDVSQGLQRLARSLNVSLKHVLLAVHVRVLNLLSGQSDIVTGMLSHGRPEVVDGERVAGLFLNVVPLRLQIPHGSWQELIQHIFATECAMLPFRRYPLAEMQRRWGGRTPLFNTAFSFFDFHVFNDMFSSGQIEDLEFRITSPNSGYILDALFFAPRRVSEPLSFELVYETARLGEYDAHRVGDYYVAAMRAMVHDAQQYYSHVCLLPQAETSKLLTAWNTPSDLSVESLPVHRLFEAQVARTPDALAVISEKQRLTYRQLNERANQLAHYLRQHAVGPDVLVGFGVERSLEMIVGLLGVLKAGGAYVPLDPAYPPDRLALLLKETQVPVLLTQQHLREKFPAHGACVVCLDSDWSEIAQQSTANLTNDIQPQNLAYVIYTSGSTGMPKGVLTAHQALTRYVEAAARAYEIGVCDRVLQFASINFDASAEEIYPCLTQGATLVLRTEAMLGSVQTFLQTCQQQGVTCMSLPTAYWHELTAQMARGALTLPACVRLVIIGGESASTHHLALWQHCTQGQVRLINTYGPTEATVIATLYEIAWRDEPGVAPLTIPIGRPLASTQVYLLDAHQYPVPIGVAGEICIGGPGLAQGYLHQAALSAERFVPHPFSQEPGARLYRTGDLARYLPDGNLEFLGRTDHQVKIRGFRIEPGEIEAVLSQHPAVQAAVVLAREDVPGDRLLVAYIVAPEEIAESEWRVYLSKHVPEYMLPSVFLRLDALPLNANGKVDRRALPVPQKGQSGVEYVAPRTPLEEQLAQIWAEVLGLERVGVQDNFFDLGGHSLKATQIVSRAQQVLSVVLSLRSLFEDPTVAGLARAVEQALQQQEGTNLTAFQPISHEEQQEQLQAYLEDMSEDEIQALLLVAQSEPGN
ncbi:MAG TPA: amino acid adenylation domain-containing protein, partial [Ktedonobacteraceae bacterium]|nr:amino acid adenylation domain-containing protein [Ktedonobacteraceae bacterium]